MAGPVRRVTGADHDVDVAVEQGDEPDEALGGESAELVIPELRDVRLGDAELLRDRRLAEAVVVDQLVQSCRELYAELPALRIGETEILKHVAAAGDYQFTLISRHTSPHSLPRLP